MASNQCALNLLVEAEYGAGFRHDSLPSRQLIGKRLAHKRLLLAGQVDRCKEDASNAVFRRPTSYVSCAFLDENDTVVAIDSRGYADIIRLPPYDGCRTPRRAQGQLLTSQLPVASSPHQHSSHFEIRSIRNGQAFVVGDAYGDFRIVATERGTRHLPKALQKLKPLPLMGGIAGSREMQWNGWQISRPTRKYFPSDKWNLAQQLRNPHDLSRLIEIYKWRESSAELRYPGPIVLSFPKGQWDFWETPSALLAAHIGHSNDNFSIRLFDERVSVQTDQLCVDLAGENSDIQHMCLCFASENLLACAAVERQNEQKHGVIKIFDMRKVAQGNPSDVYVLPSFPRSTPHGLCARETFDIFYNNIASVGVSCGSRRPAGRNQIPDVRDLTCLKNGSLMITTKRNGHFLLDHIKHTIVQVKAEDSITAKNPPIYAVDKEFGTIAEYEAHDGCQHAITLYTSECNDKRYRGKKRKSSSKGPTKIETTIQDCYGLQTQLSNMSFNESGTSIVGVSNDGDVFAWRT